MDDLIEGVVRCRVKVLGQVVDTRLQILVTLIEKVLLSAALPIVARRDEKWEVVLDVP